MLKRETATKLCMVFFMSCGMSLMQLTLNIGQIPTLSGWLRAWAVAFVLAFILTSFVTPMVLTKIIPALYKSSTYGHGNAQAPNTHANKNVQIAETAD
ncbi:hypothetical protein MmiAt1_07570 [Methanimicrococcus sp. At1]|uniref:DUF2798 domain-containing protein n=1 Tax=Methanimicrococcus hacksteinii TaxID=3028293 RepID=A0ABU3VP58_9EURY|nr:DUF2798 domain-containing protein [Methanimicrococcus sp. At1]MDV0445200.1 hypothetical protein [Methanimicrococcus sp. At1]